MCSTLNDFPDIDTANVAYFDSNRGAIYLQGADDCYDSTFGTYETKSDIIAGAIARNQAGDDINPEIP